MPSTPDLPLAAPSGTAPSGAAPRAEGLSAGDVAFALLGGFLVLVPFVRFTGFAGLYDSQRIAEVAVLVGGVLALCTAGGVGAVRAGAALVPRWAAAGLAAAVGLGLASAASAPAPRYALAEVGGYVVLLGLAVGLAGGWGGRRERGAGLDARDAVTAVAVACAVTCAWAVYANHVGDVLGGGLGWPDVTGAFSNRRTLNQVQIVAGPLVLALTARLAAETPGGALRRLAPWALRALSALHVAALIASGGRAALLSVAVGLGVVWAVGGRRAWPVVREALVALALGAVVYALVFVAFGGAGWSYGRKHALAKRDVHWAASLRILADRPWLGIGPMQYAYFAMRASAHPHNVVLQLATEWGLPAAGLLVGVAGTSVGAWLRAVRRAGAERTPWRAALTMALVGSLANAMFDSFAMVPVAQGWAVLLVAALLVEYGRMRTEAGRAPARPAAPGRSVRWRVAVPAVLLLAAAPLVAVVVQDVPTLGRRVYDRRAWINPTLLYPRFWQVGTLAPPEGPRSPRQRRYWPTVDGMPAPAAPGP